MTEGGGHGGYYPNTLTTQTPNPNKTRIKDQALGTK